MNILAQLQAAHAALPPDTQPRPRLGRPVPDSLINQIYAAMADGEVWTTAKAAKHFDVPITSARSAMLRLKASERIDLVGKLETVHGSPTPIKLYRRKT